jgi:hypothetical protein
MTLVVAVEAGPTMLICLELIAFPSDSLVPFQLHMTQSRLKTRAERIRGCGVDRHPILHGDRCNLRHGNTRATMSASAHVQGTRSAVRKQKYQDKH